MTQPITLFGRCLALCLCWSALAVAASAGIANGTWQLTVLDQGRTFTPSFTLVQDGEKLSGTYRNSIGEQPATGTIKGKDVELKVQIKGQDGQERTVVYTGTIEGEAFNGKVLTSRGGGTFTAKRLAATP